MEKSKQVLALTVVAMTIFGGLGSVYARTDAAQQLQDWYQAKYGQVTSEIQTNTVNPGLAKLSQELHSLQESLLNSASTSLEETAIQTKNRANAGIFVTVGNYIEQVWDKQSELLGTETTPGKIQSDFDTYVGDKKAEIDQELDAEASQFLSDLNNELDQEVEATQGSLERNYATAQTELGDRIRLSKQAINEKLAGEQQQAEHDLKAHLDKTIVEGKAFIEADTKATVDQVIQQVREKGNAVETEAKAEMSDVINNVAQ